MISDLLKLLLTLPFVLILPGFFSLMAIFGWKDESVSFFERAVLVVPFSIVIVDLITLLLDKLNIPLEGMIAVGSIIVFCLVCFIIYQLRFGKKSKQIKEKSEISKDLGESEKLFDFSYWQTVFILISVFLAIFIRTAYLVDTIVPSATDLGHHMYWAQTIADTGHLPSYGMPDFIIGEHIIFAVINLVSGVKIMSALPVLVLFLVNIVGIFTIAILAGRLFKNKNITALCFFTVGVLYAINAPQGKYVSGGVVGNILGNMFLPIALYFLFRALKEKKSLFAGLFVFFFMGLLYTHHLSAFILIFSVAAILLVYFVTNLKKAHNFFLEWIKVLVKPFPIAIMLLSALFLLFVFTPSYFNPEAVSQATGQPVKVTRVGLNFDQIEINAGSARLILGGLGFILLLIGFERKKYQYSFALGWTLILFLMTWKPGWLYINIPSTRVGNYLFLPLSVLAAYGMGRYFDLLKKSATKFFSAVLLYTILFFVITYGLSDSADAFKIKNQFQESLETFHSAEYLAKTIDVSQDIVLKDHVNIYGDSWYKLFFMKDYKYPLSRGILTRYEDPTKPRENCTRDMITEPQSEKGRACFSETGVNYIALNSQIEGNSFESYPEFSKVYGSNYISIFRRN
jgi:hypothetical protein